MADTQTPEIVRAEHTAISGMCQAWDAEGNRYTVKRWSGFGPNYVYPGTRTDGGSVGTIAQRDLNRALGLYVTPSGTDDPEDARWEAENL